MPNQRPDCRLIIFLKPPVKGKVKTRLAKHIGDGPALQMYHHLISKTLDCASRTKIPITIYVSAKKSWSGYKSKRQMGQHLGLRMYNAFKSEFKAGAKRVIIIGTDCIDLEPSDIQRAVSLLVFKSFVLGPSSDGGYYLIASNSKAYSSNPMHFRSVFTQIPWSTKHVLPKTLQKLKKHRFTSSLLPKRIDLDTNKNLTPNNLKFLYSA